LSFALIIFLRTADLRSVRDKGDHGSVGTGDHEDPDVTPSGVLDSGQEHISDGHENKTCDDVQRSLPRAVRVPRVADDDKERKDLSS
jgi:hypothetical protein